MQKLMQIKEYLLELAFVALLLRVLFLGTGIGEAIAFVSLVLSIGYKAYLEKNQANLTEVMQNKLNEMESKINSLSIDRLRRNTNEQEIPVNKASTPKRLF